MKIGNLLVNSAYLGNKVLTAIAVGATKVWEGVSKYIKFADPVVESLCMKWSSDGVGLTPEDAAKVTDIGNTFKGNTEITSFDELKMLTSVTSLNNYAFADCSNLISIDVNNVENYSSRVFSNCTSLASVKGLDTCRQMNGASIFYNCPIEVDLNMPNLTGTIPWGCFYGTKITNVLNLGSITSIGVGAGAGNQGLFGSTKSLGSVTLPSSLVEIGNFCFFGSAVRSINLENVRVIGGSAFGNCTELSIDILSIPNATSIGNDAFLGCKIKRITNLGGITYAFKLNNANVQMVRLPSTITSAASYAYSGCKSLTELVIEATNPFPISTYFIGASDPIKQKRGYIYVHDESVEVYKSATNWSAFADQIKPLSEYQPTNE